MTDPDYDVVVSRINEIYNSSTKQEQQMLKQILGELAHSGYSYTYEQIFLNDFKEVPVGIDTFISHPYYLGATNSEGATVYDFWKQTFRNIFNAGNKYTEIVLQGATRIGKSSSAVTMMAYMLYKLMLYRDPHKYFNKKAISRFTLAFANLTKDLAMGVAFHEFNTTLKAVPWFQDHGTMNKSIAHPIYIPEGDKIDIVPASDGAHLLGMQVWACLLGNTRLQTIDGTVPIHTLSGQSATILQYDPSTGEKEWCIAEVKETRRITEWIRIELEDGSILEGTSDHLIMLSSGQYKELGMLTEDDDIMTEQEMQWHNDIESLVPHHMDEGEWRFIEGTTVPYKHRGTLRPIAVCSNGRWIILLSYNFGGNHGLKRARIEKFHDVSGPDDGRGHYKACSAGYVHRLVAKAFLPDWDDSLQVNHKNGMRDCNDVSNLEMVTTQQNTAHFWQSDCFSDTRERMKNLDHSCSEETKAKLRVACKGWKQSAETIERIRHSKLGHEVSGECRNKIRNTLKKTHGTQQPCYFKDNPSVIFNSVSSACASIGRWSGYIGECLKNNRVIRDANNCIKEIVFIEEGKFT